MAHQTLAIAHLWYWEKTNTKKSTFQLVESVLIDVMLFLSSILTLQNIKNIIKCTKLRGGGRKKSQKKIRQCVPPSQVWKLVLVLMIPQLILQILNFVTPSLQSTYTTAHYDDLKSAWEHQSCKRMHGGWPTYVGMLFALMSFIITFILSVRSENLPDMFNESVYVQSSLKTFLLILLCAGPSWMISVSPNQQVYLLSCILLSLLLPYQWYLLIHKILKHWNETKECMKKAFRPQRSNTSTVSPECIDDRRERTEVTIQLAKVYIDLGISQLALHSLDEALKSWKIDHFDQHTNHLGGFTKKELDFMSADDLDCVIRLSIARCKVISTLFPTDQSQNENVAILWLDVLKIYENSPQAVNIVDKSIIFPVFSGLFVFLKIGAIKDDDKSFEKDMIDKFINTAEAHGDPIHHLRALSMKAAFLGNNQQYENALEIVELIKSKYVAEEHSCGISESYGSDRVVQIISQSAVWEYALGKKDNAMSTCNYVVEDLLPKMDLTNSLNSTELLIPVMSIFKVMGGKEKAIHALFHENIIQPFHEHYGEKGNTPWMALHRPMTVLLELLITEDDREGKEMQHDLVYDNEKNVQEEAEWFLEGGNGEYIEIFQVLSLALGWHVNTITCEACLLLAQKIGPTNQTLYPRLLSKALILAKHTIKQMRDSDTDKIICLVAYKMHVPILREIEVFIAKGEELNLISIKSEVKV